MVQRLVQPSTPATAQTSAGGSCSYKTGRPRKARATFSNKTKHNKNKRNPLTKRNPNQKKKGTKSHGFCPKLQTGSLFLGFGQLKIDWPARSCKGKSYKSGQNNETKQQQENHNHPFIALESRARSEWMTGCGDFLHALRTRRHANIIHIFVAYPPFLSHLRLLLLFLSIYSPIAIVWKNNKTTPRKNVPHRGRCKPSSLH